MGGVIADTCFLIDLQREERRKQREGKAHTFLLKNDVLDSRFQQLPGESSSPVLTAGGDSHPVVARIAPSIRFENIGIETTRVWAKISRELTLSGNLIAANDLWIAASALASGLPLVTRNVAHFERVPGLQLLTY